MTRPVAGRTQGLLSELLSGDAADRQSEQQPSQGPSFSHALHGDPALSGLTGGQSHETSSRHQAGGAALRAPWALQPPPRSHSPGGPSLFGAIRSELPLDVWLPMGGYLLARHIDGRPIDAAGIDRLVPAQEALVDARQALPFGRGNIDMDLQRTNGASRVRTHAARQLRLDAQIAGTQLMPGIPASVNLHLLIAMSAYAFLAGNCSEYARVAAFAYGSRAQQRGRPASDTVAIYELPTGEHVWAEAPSSAAGQSPVVIDAWADGPAVFVEDAQFPKDRRTAATVGWFDLRRAARAGNTARLEAESIRRQPRNGIAERLDRAEREIAASPTAALLSGEQPLSTRYPRPQRILSDAFAARVHDRLETGDPRYACLTEIQAACIAMSLGSEGVKRIANDAAKIVDSATALIARDQ